MENKKIQLQNQEVDYELRKSRRARRMRVAVYCDASVIVTLPYRMNENIMEKFLREKATWLLDKISYFKKYPSFLFIKSGKREFLKNKMPALQFAQARVNYFNIIYQLRFNKISVKRQKTRWGSCSRKGNLNFNYKILFLPVHIVDYIIVHELCHLKEFNHSKRFWALVAQTVPNYLEIRKELKRGLVG